MLAKDLIKKCYDKIIIYCDNGIDFDTLYSGCKESIPNFLLNKEVRLFGAKGKDIIEIEIVNNDDMANQILKK